MELVGQIAILTKVKIKPKIFKFYLKNFLKKLLVNHSLKNNGMI